MIGGINMSKTIYEFYYIVGEHGFDSCYDCVVEKETNKMFYGNVFKNGEKLAQRFAINKENLNQIHRIINKYHGLMYRVQIESSNYDDARKKAANIIYDHMIDFVEAFKNCEEE
jgi:hypothetical protein